MTEEWKKTLSNKYNRPLPEEKKQPEKKNMEAKSNKSFRSSPKKKEEEKPNRCLPLYSGLGYSGKESFCEKKELSSITANAGLLFDKFCDHWSGEKNWKPEIMKKGSVKQQFLDDIVTQLKNNKETDKLLPQYHARRSSLISALHGESKVFTTSWRFVSGLGMGHVLETGFVWHRTLGVPYLPGSSVKGLIRAWAKDWNDEKKWEEYERLFGDSKDMGAGSLIVFDTIPETKPTLELDIMNPHYGDYYSKIPMKIKLANGREQTIDTPPADYLSPKPIFFLTVAPDVSFKFALAPRPGVGNSADLNNGYTLLKEALENIGAGAKTAVGYGYFRVKQ